MFEFVRKHNRVMQFLLVLLIFPSFVLFGLEGYNRYNEQGEAVAKVDGREIKQSEWDEAHKKEVDRVRSQNPGLDAKMLDTPAFKYAMLERIVRDRVIAAAADKAHLTTTDQRLARELQKNEMIASMRGPDGKLDMARYRALLGAQGMTPEMYEAGVRADLSARQLFAGVSGTSFATPQQAALSINPFFEKREVQVARFAPAEFASKVTITDADLDTFYKANPSMFQTPEQANIEYVVLDLETVKKGITLAEQDVKSYFEQNQKTVAGQEERRASHILVPLAKGASEADRAKAKEKADQLLAAVKKAPDSFADVAKKESKHEETAAKGGDLDFFVKDAMLPAVANLAFSLKKGEIGGPVESELGLHIVKLTDIKAAPKPKTFEESRTELEATLKTQQAQRKFAESADAFSNTVYEQADSLKPVADKLKLEIRTASGVRRTPAAGATGPLASEKFLNALFAPDSVDKKRNTEAVEAGPSALVSGRVAQYMPARTLPFAEVKEQVREKLVAARSSELAKKEGMAKLAAWKAAPATATLSPAVTLSRQDAANQPQPLVEAALRADPGALPGFVGVDLGAQGYAVVKVNKLVARENPTDEVAKQERQQYSQWWATAEGIAYYNLLKERLKVTIKAPKPEMDPLLTK
ncbi:SurA N-terminal domain-containing protein [Caenimonas sp. SL110]|uniref:SurA N-terminal domain-containing protein n=1 Tax=Caenimonas sp. SL110 TaxID=1450524 RepID=UPI000653602B|nr:SurA N-terminal domain-containing protein [Caenimonas sp. SL110]